MLWWVWVVLGLVLLGLEMVSPGGFFVFFFGVAALLVGVTVASGWGGPPWVQWLLFCGLSVVSLLIFRGPLLARVRPLEREQPIDTLRGEVAIPLENLAPNAIGKAELRGTTWTVRNADERALGTGQRCRVSHVEGLTLWIRAE